MVSAALDGVLWDALWLHMHGHTRVLAVVGLLGQGIWTARDARKGYGRGED
jgi:hypothetical protein